ncbi:MAG: hypothetical protein FJ318_02235 [SAR202 cluster bacterium]|nr:hypothetical protein [SAR202 cluster bacterium]
MKFDQRLTVRAPKEAVDRVLADVPRVASFVPGVEDVKPLGGDDYEGKVRVSLGPMSFRFAGKGEVLRDAAAGTWRLKAHAKDARIGGGVDATIAVQVIAVDASTTDLAIDADVTMLGRIGDMGQPIMRRKAKSMIAEFGKRLQAAATAG